MSISKDIYKPIYRVIPSSLKPRFESGVLDVKCLFFVSDLAYEVVKREGRVRSHLPRDRDRDFLVKMLTNKYRRTVDLLIAEDIIQVRSNEEGKESYSTTHHHCKQYSLTKKYRDELNNDGVSGLMITDHRQLKRMYSFWENSIERTLEKHPWLQPELHALSKLNYKTEEGEHFLKETITSRFYRNEPLTNKQSEKLVQANNDLDSFLNSDNLPFVSVRNGRVYNKLVNANKEFRKFIVTDSGERLVEVDMRSAQWVMLCKALVLKNKYSYTTNLIDNLTKHIEEPVDLLSNTYNDTIAFISSVLFQDIYSELGILKTKDSYVIPSGLKHQEREEFKKEAIAESLYNYFRKPTGKFFLDNKGRKHVRGVVKDTYPSVYDFIVQCAEESNKKRRSSDLAILMQKYEGFFFHQALQGALEGLLEGDGYAIIHDAFYLPESKEKEARKIMQETAEKWFGVMIY